MSSARLSAPERMARLLSVIPWVTQRGATRIDDIVERFAYPREQLLGDLRDVVFFVGVHPFTPDTLIDVELGDDTVTIRYADWFSRPLRLTAAEGARLLTAGRAVLAAGPGAEVDDAAGPLMRALTKLAVMLGAGADSAVEVRLGDAPDEVLATLRRAIDDDRRVAMEYYAYGRDELTSRDVDPRRVFTDRGHWYLIGWCHRAGAERVFRLDRVRSLRALEQARSAAARSIDAGDPAPQRDVDGPEVTVRLDPSAAWVIEHYPVLEVSEEPGGTLLVRLAVTAQPWLERLLLGLGDSAELVDSGPYDPDLVATAARRVLARYSASGL